MPSSEQQVLAEALVPFLGPAVWTGQARGSSIQAPTEFVVDSLCLRCSAKRRQTRCRNHPYLREVVEPSPEQHSWFFEPGLQTSKYKLGLPCALGHADNETVRRSNTKTLPSASGRTYLKDWFLLGAKTSTGGHTRWKEVSERLWRSIASGAACAWNGFF